MTRVVLLTTNLARGGAEIQVAQLARVLHLRGWSISVISLLPPSGLASELAALGIPVFSLGMKPGKPSLRAMGRLIRLLNKLKPEILHAHMFHANLVACVMRLLCPIPAVICTIHSTAESGRSSRSVRVRDWVYRATGWLSDATVCVSKAAAVRHVEARAISAKRFRLIANGVDTIRFQPNARNRTRMRDALAVGSAFTWLAVGRLMWKKDYRTMLTAMAGQSDSVLLIAGDGPLESELRALALQLSANVRFLGGRDDIPELMNASDALVLSSTVEGLPMVLLEAAASGLPCIATDVGGVREIVVHRTTGYVVPPENPAELGQAMRELAELPPEARRKMSHDAREQALAHFDLNAITSQWETLYRELIESAWT